MINSVRLYEVQHANDYYELDEKGEQDPRACSNLVYTDEWEYLVEWYDEDVCIQAQERTFGRLEKALEFYKQMKAEEMQAKEKANETTTFWASQRH